MPTVLITGCSSGFGLETARLFAGRGWQVVATMRTPRDDLFPPAGAVRVLPLDVTDPRAVAALAAAAGPVDVLVNNAGVGLLSVVEATEMDTIRALFEANTFGLMAVTRAFLPGFRGRRAGVVVNVSSSTTLKPLPLLAVYTASKAAVNAFTESLALELAPFGVRVRLVIPGRSPETPFSENARAGMARQRVAVPEAYAGLAAGVFGAMAGAAGPVTRAADVAEAVWRAATDPACPVRLPAGADAVALAGPA